MANLELKVLGGLSLRRNGLPIPDLKTQKGLALLCYLAVTRQPASRAALAGLLWPEMPEAHAHMNLRKVLFRLKPLSDHLAITRSTLAFDLSVPHCLDLEDFEANAASPGDIGRLQRAVELYAGDFLEGFYLDDAPPFDEWVLGQQARLRALALRALQALVDHFSGLAAYDTAAGYARRLLALEAWHEETHFALMRLLALGGQRSAALVQYEVCREVLARELGVAPAAATTSLYEQIKLGVVGGQGASAAALTRGQPADPMHSLPIQTTPFVGREAELAALAVRLADPNVRLLTILGLGGMGKTRLALASAGAEAASDRPGRRFAHGIVFVALARLEAHDQLVPAIAEALDLRFVAGREPKAQLLDFLRHKAMLLVLDNFEHLRAGANLVDEILRAAARIKVLVTSRERLNLQSEYLFPIAGMALPGSAGGEAGEGSAALSHFGAIQLFCERARRVQPDFELSPANEAEVLEICRLVHGMPLGIVLASAWLETLSLSQIAAEIRADLDFLQTEMHDMPERQRSLRAAFNHAWRLLPQAERAAFQRLSVFRGGFTRMAAQRVAGATLSDLHGLVNKSLLSVSASGRYDVHELLRQYATEILAAAPEVEREVHDHHSQYYCAFLAEHSDHWHTGRQLETLAVVSSEADNIQRAWQRALELGACDRLLPALACWAEYLGWHGLDVEAESTFRTLAGRMQELASDEPAASPAVYHLWAMAQARQATFTLHGPTAVQLLHGSLRLIERPELSAADIRRDRAFVLSTLGGTYYGLDRKAARPLLEAGLALYEACNDARGIAICLNSLGHLDWATGHYAVAQERCQTALAMFVALGDLGSQLGALDALSWIHKHAGRLAEVLRLRRQALDLSYQLGNRPALPSCLANYAFILNWLGQYEEMRRWAYEGLAICQELRQRGSEGYVRLAVCMSFMGAGQYDAARGEGLLALSMTREAGAHGVEATVHWALGCLALIDSDCQAARASFAESRRLYEEVEDNYIGLVLPAPGYVAIREGRPAQARAHFLESLQAALALKDYLYLIVALPGVALYLCQVGAITRSLEVWELALGQPYIAKCRWHADLVGRPLEAAAAALAPAERQAARERGRGLDAWATAERLVTELQCQPVLGSPMGELG